MKYFTILLLFLFARAGISFAQQKLITGVVFDEEHHEPVSFANITIQSQNRHYSTDEKGGFRITAMLPDSLIIYKIGYHRLKIAIDANTSIPINIILKKEDLLLEEVTVSTGYQKIPRERSTGSFATVSNQLLNEQIGTNVLDRLGVITNGLTTMPEKASLTKEFTIRGLSTVYGPTAPLVIVDNFPYEGDLNNINPNDVENITVLKDAAATSIWGARAGNGVIVINTKQGRYNQKQLIQATSNITVINKPDIMKEKRITSSELVDVEKMLFEKGFYEASVNNLPTYPLTEVQQLLYDHKKGLLSNDELDNSLTALRKNDNRKDLLKYWYERAVNQQYALSLNGGAGNYRYFVSGGYDRNLGVLGERYDRVTLRLNNNFRLSKKIEITTGIALSSSARFSGKPNPENIRYTGSRLLPRYTALADAAGKPLALYNNYRKSFIDTAGNGLLEDWNYYPLKDYKDATQTSKARDINAELGLNYKIFSFLDFNARYRYEMQGVNDRMLFNAESFYARDWINRLAVVNPVTGQVNYPVPRGGILDLSETGLQAQNIRGQFIFNQGWDDHAVNILLGSELSDKNVNSNTYRTYGYSEQLLTSKAVDYVNPYYDRTIQYTNYIPNVDGFNRYTTRFVSFYGNGSYTYKNRYTVSGSARKDASNIFGLAINDKWKPLWSAGFAWDIAKEKFYKISWLPFLKARFTYGFSGNIDPAQVAVTTLRYTGNNFYNRLPMASVSNYFNPELQWETVRIVNYGLDYRTAGGRFFGSVEFYTKDGKKLYGPSEIDPTTGIGATIIRNIADIRGRGWDIEFNARLLQKKFTWYLQFILNTNRDKVVNIYRSSNRGSSLLGGSLQPYKDHPLYGIYAFKWAGLDGVTGDPIGYINDVQSRNYRAIAGDSTSIKQMVFKGSSLPTTFGSWGNSFSYKNLSLSVRLIYKLGYYFRESSINYESLFNQLAGHTDYTLRWQQPGDEKHTQVPSMIYPLNSDREFFYSNAEVLVKKADNIRLQYITIGYEMQRRSMSWLPFEYLRLTGVINDAGLIWKSIKGTTDPDYVAGYSPRPRFSFGLNIGL